MDVFNIGALSWKPLVSIVVLAALPAAITYVALRAGKSPGALRMTLMACAVTLPLFALAVAQMMTAKVRLTGEALVVGGGIYRVSVPYEDVVASGIVVGDTNRMPRLRIRTNGIGLPGFAMGWFQSDQRKIFAAYSGADGSMYIPTRLEYDLLVSPTEAGRIAEELAARSQAGQPTP